MTSENLHDYLRKPGNNIGKLLEKIDNSKLFEAKYKNGHPRLLKQGQLIEWVPSDCYGDLKQKLEKYPLELEVYNRYPVLYRINEQGFRSNLVDYREYENQEVEIVLGCSFTFGIGFHLEHTWPYILNKLLNEKNQTPVINLSLPGTGGDTAFRLLLTYLTKFKKVKRIIHLQPFYSRFEFLEYTRAINFHAPGVEEDVNVRKHYTKYHRQSTLTNETVHVINHLKNINACRGLAEERNIPYFYSHTGPSQDEASRYEIFARDIDHGGFTGQYKIADIFRNKIENGDTSVVYNIIGDYSLNQEPVNPNHDTAEYDKAGFLKYIENNPEVSKFYPNAYYSRKVI